MKGRIEKMPNVTNARVANVQKKSFERKAAKNAINAGRRRAAITVTMPLARNTATTGHNSEPSGARRIANNAMSATANAAAQSNAAGGTWIGFEEADGRVICGSLTAKIVISSVMARMTATTP